MKSKKIVGAFGGVSSDGWVHGWAYAPERGRRAVEVRIVVDDAVVDVVKADQFLSGATNDEAPTPFCAFWYRLPRRFRDDAEHIISIVETGHDVELSNSPQRFTISNELATHDSGALKNYVNNSNFNHWPNGLVIDASGQFCELAAEWHADSKKNSKTSFIARLAKPVGRGLLENDYAMRIEIAENDDTNYVRLVTKLAFDASSKPGTYYFSCGLDKSQSIDDTLVISEILIAYQEGRYATKIATIRKHLRFSGTTKVRNVPFTIDRGTLATIDENKKLSLILNFRGNGNCTLFDPSITSGQSESAEAIILNDFEDYNIRSQFNRLNACENGAAEAVSRVLGSIPDKDNSFNCTPFTQIIIPVYNALYDVIELLESIQRCTRRPYEVILADDGSDGNTTAIIDEYIKRDPRVVLLSSAENNGYTININRALGHSSAEFVVVLNSDTIVTPGWLEKLHQAMAADPDTAAVGPLSNAASWQSVPKVKDKRGWAFNKLPQDMSVDDLSNLIDEVSLCCFPTVPLLNGFCTLYRRSALQSIGFFDDDSFPLGYGEENDLSFRLSSAGFRLRVADHCYVYHKKSKSFGATRRAALSSKANQKLRRKHPAVNIAELEDEIGACSSINHVRESLETNRVGAMNGRRAIVLGSQTHKIAKPR